MQGIRPEPTDELVVRKPKVPGRSSVKSTLYRAYAGKYSFIYFFTCILIIFEV